MKTLGVNCVWEESFLFFLFIASRNTGFVNKWYPIIMFLTDRMLISTCGVTLQSAFGKLTINICSRHILNKTKLKMLRDNSGKLVNLRISGTLILKVFEYIVVDLIFFL